MDVKKINIDINVREIKTDMSRESEWHSYGFCELQIETNIKNHHDHCG
jgi:hypothetical protein